MSTPDLDSIRALLDRRANPGGTHWVDCRGDHIDCAAQALLDEVDRQRRRADHFQADAGERADEVDRLRTAIRQVRRTINEQRYSAARVTVLTDALDAALGDDRETAP